MIQLKRNDTLYQQIAAHFEQEIREGHLQPGYKFPSTVELSKEFGVNPDTIQQSLKILMNQGLISRAPKRGTFVKKSFFGNTLGIVFGKEIFADSNYAFFPQFLCVLKQYAESQGWKTRIFMTTVESLADPGLYELRKAVESGELGCIVDFCVNHVTKEYLDEKCTVPIGKYAYPDYEHMVRTGLDYLIGHGYSHITLFVDTGADSKIGTKKNMNQILQEYQNLNFGRQLRLSYEVMRSRELEGYRNFKKMWDSPDRRPEAILITNDCLFKGVWYAIMEYGIKVPGELALISHLNKGNEPMTHLPITAMEVQAIDFAKTVFDELQARIRGEKYPFKRIKAVLREGKTC